MKKFISLLIASVMLIGIMVGCGTSSTSQTETTQSVADSETNKDATTTTAAPADKRAEVSGNLVVQSWQYGGVAPDVEVTTDNEKNLKNLQDYFNKFYPKINAQFQFAQYSDHFTKLKIDLASGTGPDVIGIQVGAPLEEFKPFLQPLAPYAEKEWGADWKSRFIPSAFTQIDQSGAKEEYAMPMSMLFAGTMYYSQTLLDKAGLKQAPATWDELKTAAKALRDSKQMPLVTGAKDAWINLDVFLVMAADINSQKIYDAIDGKGTWTDPDVVKAFDFWQKLFTEKIYQDGAVGLNMYNEAVSLWRDDKGNCIAPLHTNGSWEMGSFSSANPNLKNFASFNRGVARFPGVKGDGQPCPILSSPDVVWAMNKDTKNAEAAWSFIKWQADEEGQQCLANGLAFFPVKVGVAPTVDMSPELKAIYNQFIDWGKTAVGGYREIRYPELKQALCDTLQLLATSSITPQKAGEAVEKASKAQKR